ncbi:hypothetical protein AALP_AAs44920U000200 [Arabis alpina]|uniref:Uncharacterized protein n=1 Tax=Arabis alpina TaxID=50452 RepID=A0A087FZL2_ARAAL|nr:hypothetical protein AALP_AAs44920U000200 [Arabis alpina]
MRALIKKIQGSFLQASVGFPKVLHALAQGTFNSQRLLKSSNPLFGQVRSFGRKSDKAKVQQAGGRSPRKWINGSQHAILGTFVDSVVSFEDSNDSFQKHLLEVVKKEFKMDCGIVENPAKMVAEMMFTKLVELNEIDKETGKNKESIVHHLFRASIDSGKCTLTVTVDFDIYLIGKVTVPVKSKKAKDEISP